MKMWFILLELVLYGGLFFVSSRFFLFIILCLNVIAFIVLMLQNMDSDVPLTHIILMLLFGFIVVLYYAMASLFWKEELKDDN